MLFLIIIVLVIEIILYFLFDKAYKIVLLHLLLLILAFVFLGPWWGFADFFNQYGYIIIGSGTMTALIKYYINNRA